MIKLTTNPLHLLSIVLVTTLVQHQVQVEACLKCPPERSFGSQTPISFMKAGDFPPLEFAKMAVDGSEVEKKILEAEENNKVSEITSRVLNIVSAGLDISDVAWQLLEPVFIQFQDLTELKIERFAQQNRNENAENVIHQLSAQLVPLKDSITRMTNKDIYSQEERLREVVPARYSCSIILSLFKNERYIFWKENLYTTKYLLAFSIVHATIGKLSRQLDPSHSNLMEREKQELLQVLRKYQENVIPKRINVIVEKSRRNVSSRYYDDLKKSEKEELIKESVCDHLYYVKTFCKSSKELFKYILRPTSNLPNQDGTTSCLKGVWDQKIINFYRARMEGCPCMGELCPGCPDKDALLVHPVLKEYFHPFNDPPAAEVKFIYDGISDTYACNYAVGNKGGGCYQDYCKIVEQQVNDAFNEKITFIEKVNVN